MAVRETLPEAGRGRANRSLTIWLLCAGSLLFIALGLWQIERRAEKSALISAVERRLSQPPVAAPGPPDWPRITFRTDAYRQVRIRGVFHHDQEVLVQAVTRHGPGYWVMTPLETDAGWMVLVNRGFVSPEDRARSSRLAGEPQGEATVSGLLRITEPAGAFLHANDPMHDRWYSRDVVAIGRSRHLVRLASYFIDAGPTGDRGRQPIGGLTVISFSNNHLQYALTWFALATLSVSGMARIWWTGGKKY
jgi:surfeit locus 1 family protein